ncbi:MAG: SUMF1/EgtB/PvdO family nonheme iron enzyme [Oscillospiraceae bacterium]|nr:SUMF1/EgtB/PvdO family nonheme iron enzyme [Oscillospiraceae bacterium]
MKKIFSLLLAAVLLLAALPGAAGAAKAAGGPVSGDKLTQTLTTEMIGVKFDTSFDMVFVEGGTFTLGWEASDASMRPESVTPVRNVTVSDFYIGETEVTVSLWNAVMGLPQPGADADRPKENVNFYAVQEFLARLYVLTGRTYRLATEAEWEFAAKGGNPGLTGNAEYPGNNHKYLFAGSNVHDEVVASRTSVQNVKTKKPNILGIYDLCGNAEEWVYNSFDANLVGGVDPIGPAGPFHQQKTRRGGIYGGLPDSTRTLVARQVRSIDGGAGVGFRIALSGDMNSVPPGMIRPMDVVHPNIDERNLPVTYRDQRMVTGDGTVWESSIGSFQSFRMKLWDTGEMVIQAAGFSDRVGQWYSVSNLGVVFVEDAFTENEKRMTLPYMFMTENFATIINDVSFIGDGAPVHRMEKHADEGSGIVKPTGLTLYAPEALAEASTHDHTSYDLTNITPEMKGHDERLIDGEGYGWWLSAPAIGAHQYRQDITDSIFRFVVYSPSFGNGTGGADQGYGGNYLAQGAWYTVNDMLLVVGEGAAARHYLYTVTGETSSYIRSGQRTRQLMEISYMGYERGDSRYLELHPNDAIRGYSKDIPAGWAFPPEKPSTFMAEAETETLCPGGCGQVISKCLCPTMCPVCHEHLDNCYCNDAPQRLDAGVRAAQSAFAACEVSNSVTQAHLDAAARLAIGSHNITRSWSGFTKVNATREQAGSVKATLTLSLNGYTKTLNVDLPIGALPKADTAGVAITPDAALGGKPVTMTATDLEESFTVFDIGSLFGMPGAFGYTYALWFGSEGTFSFDRDVTLTKSYFDASLTELGRDSIPVKAGETVRVADGVYSEFNGKTVSWSEFSVTLDDGCSWMIVYREDPGNYAATPPDTPLSDFPGKVGSPYRVQLTNQKLKVNGVEQSFEIYNINDKNYFKLRDLAYVLNGTGSQFSVDYDAATHRILCVTGQAYTPVGGEVQPGADKSSTAKPSTHSLYINGEEVRLEVFNIGDNNFFQLRALGDVLNFKVDYDSATRTMLVDSVS